MDRFSRRTFARIAGGSVAAYGAVGTAGCYDTSTSPLAVHRGEGLLEHVGGGVLMLLPRGHRIEGDCVLGAEPDFDGEGFDALGVLNTPVAAVHIGASLFVLEQGGARIQRFEGWQTREVPVARETFGSFGSASGEFASPHDLIAHDDTLYVADTLNHRVQELDTRGRVLRVLGGEGMLNGPRSLDVDVEGNLHVADYDGIAVFDARGTLRGRYGESLHASAIRIDDTGIAFVVDSHESTVTRFVDGERIASERVEGVHRVSIRDGVHVTLSARA